MYFPTLPEFGDYRPLDYFRKITRNIIGLNTKIKNKKGDLPFSSLYMSKNPPDSHDIDG
jgi:hypothetical protein